MKPFTVSLWFDDNAMEAAEYYTGVFPDGRISRVMRYTEAGPGPEGSVVTVEWSANGMEFVGINGGPLFHFSEAFSLMVWCETQEQVDHYWDTLIADGGEPSQCGWLKDRFGLSWQVVPTMLNDLIGDGTPGAVAATRAMLDMGKLDIAALQAAYEAA